MVEYRNGSHTVYDIQYHFVWITKGRRHILRGRVAEKMRDLLKQGCSIKKIKIVRGSVVSDHVHMLLSCPTDLAPSQIAQYLKGRSSHLIQEAFPELKEIYHGQHIWERGYFCCTVGEEKQEVMRRYVEMQGRVNEEDYFQIEEW